MCPLSRESEPVCPLGIREDKHSLLSNTEIPKDPIRPLDRVGDRTAPFTVGATRPGLDTWEKKASPEDGGTAHTQLYICNPSPPERGGSRQSWGWLGLFAAVLASQSSKARRMEIHLRPITHSFPIPQPFSVTSRKLCQPTSCVL